MLILKGFPAIVGGKYKLEQELTFLKGRKKLYGPQIFFGKNLLNGKPVSIKIERITQKKRMHDLRNEAMIYKQMQGIKGFPKMYFYGKQGVYNVLVSEYMGTTLKKL